MNSLFTLEPYCRNGIWAFDDQSRQLQAEPFVGETNEVINRMCLEAGLDLQKASNGIVLMFGHVPFPHHQIELNLLETAPSGSTYQVEKYGLKPWLCPAFFKYFPQAPQKFYGAVLKYAGI